MADAWPKILALHNISYSFTKALKSPRGLGRTYAVQQTDHAYRRVGSYVSLLRVFKR